MRFSIITPVFDPCLESLELLYKDLSSQTYGDWVWMLCSNSFSEKMQRFVTSKKSLGENRVTYFSTGYAEETNKYSRLANIGERRNFCIEKADSDYLFMIDADAKILDADAFRVINHALSLDPRSICLYKIMHEVGVLPIFPITYLRIDLLNFCVKTSLAKKVGYPTKINYQIPPNDWRFFGKAYDACKGDYLFIDKVLFEHNGNNRYSTALKMLYPDKTTRSKREQEKDYIFYCVRRNNLLGLLNLVKEFVVQRKILPESAILKTKFYA